MELSVCKGRRLLIELFGSVFTVCSVLSAIEYTGDSFLHGSIRYGVGTGVPGYFNTDQGCQFTSQDFTGRLLLRDIRISMNGRDRALDNIFVVRPRRGKQS